MYFIYFSTRKNLCLCLILIFYFVNTMCLAKYEFKSKKEICNEKLYLNSNETTIYQNRVNIFKIYIKAINKKLWNYSIQAIKFNFIHQIFKCIHTYFGVVIYDIPSMLICTSFQNCANIVEDHWSHIWNIHWERLYILTLTSKESDSFGESYDILCI